MHQLRMYSTSKQCVNSAKACSTWNLRSRAVRQVTGALPEKLQATTAGMMLAGMVLASEADAQGAWQPAPLDTVVAPASKQVQPLPQLASAPPAAAAAAAAPTGASPRPFDVVLLSIVRVTDDLSNAADSLLELLELTAAADSTLAGDAGDFDIPSLSNNGSGISSNSSSQAAGAVQLTQVLHASTASSAPALADAGSSLPLPAADQQVGASTAQRMSQQALAVAAEALRLATLLEGQQDGCDPAEQELLQQVAAAARLVSTLAADIVQPTEQGGADLTLSTSSSSPASAVTAESTAGAADGGSSISHTELHSFAGLPVLGLQVSDSSCGLPAETAASLPAQCLHL